jgi:hypothetical protein
VSLYLRKEHYIRFAIGVVFLIVIFGRTILIGRGTSFIYRKHNYFEESRVLFYTFDNSIYAIRDFV